MRFEIVVAHYQEDLSWTNTLANVTIYSKGPNGSLPNIGREAHTYLYHIVNRYDNLADRTAFVQGEPFDHPLIPFEDQANSTEPFLAVNSEECLFAADHCWGTDDNFSSVGEKTRGYVIRGESLLSFSRTFLGLEPPATYWFSWGAQFCVSRERVRSQPVNYYQSLLDLLCKEEYELAGHKYSNYELCVLFEWMWPTIFRSAAGHAMPSSA